MGDHFDLSFPPQRLLLRLAFAIVLGVLLAWRPGCRRPMRMDVRQALLIMTVASAIVVTVIGDSMARAFGVVGLGSFIRFRSSIKDPRDVVLFFVAIGTGMACGLGTVLTAAIGMAVLWVILVVLDYLSRNEALPKGKPSVPEPDAKPPTA